MGRMKVGRRVLLSGLGGAMAGSLLTGPVQAGSLEPPPGPVGPTGRPLRDIEPREPVNGLAADPGALHVISVGGSFTLTGDLVVTGGQVAIRITTTDPVSIDLRGFSIKGGGGGGGGGILVETQGATSSYVEVFDGYIRDMDGDGINGGSVRVLECYDVHISHVSRGIVASASLTVEGCVVEHCASDGILWDKATSESAVCIVDDTEVRSSNGNGVAIAGDWNNDNIDTLGFTASITDTDVVGNALDGIHVDLQSSGSGGGHLSAMIQDVRAMANGGRGVNLQAPPGPLGTAASLAVQCEDVVCTGNVVVGFRVSDSTADLVDCVCSRNLGDGFLIVNTEGSIDSCVATGNAGDGVHLQGSSRMSVSEVVAASNGSAGIHLDLGVTGTPVQDNDVRDQPIGIRVQSAGNLLVRNAATGNGSNYQLNPATPVVIVTPNDLATSSNPHANYSFPSGT